MGNFLPVLHLIQNEWSTRVIFPYFLFDSCCYVKTLHLPFFCLQLLLYMKTLKDKSYLFAFSVNNQQSGGGGGSKITQHEKS